MSEIRINMNMRIANAITELSNAMRDNLNEKGSKVTTVHLGIAILPMTKGESADDAGPAVMTTYGNDIDATTLCGSLFAMTATRILAGETPDGRSPNVEH